MRDTAGRGEMAAAFFSHVEMQRKKNLVLEKENGPGMRIVIQH